MSERTRNYFNVKMLNAIIVAYTDCFVINRAENFPNGYYQEGKIFYQDLHEIKYWKNRELLQCTKKGYKYRNIWNRPGSIYHFIQKVAKTKAGAHHVDFYDAQVKGKSTILFTEIV